MDVVGVAFAFFWPDYHGACSSFVVDDGEERVARMNIVNYK